MNMLFALTISVLLNLFMIYLCVNSFQKWDRDQKLKMRLGDQVHRRDIVITEMSAMAKELQDDEYDSMVRTLNPTSHCE